MENGRPGDSRLLPTVYDNATSVTVDNKSYTVLQGQGHSHQWHFVQGVCKEAQEFKEAADRCSLRKQVQTSRRMALVWALDACCATAEVLGGATEQLKLCAGLVAEQAMLQAALPMLPDAEAALRSQYTARLQWHTGTMKTPSPGDFFISGWLQESADIQYLQTQLSQAPLGLFTSHPWLFDLKKRCPATLSVLLPQPLFQGGAHKGAAAAGPPLQSS